MNKPRCRVKWIQCGNKESGRSESYAERSDVSVSEPMSSPQQPLAHR